MFDPIIHNLSSTSEGYAEVNYYNKLIKQHPVLTGNLASKIAALSAWKTACRKALHAAGKAVEGTIEPGSPFTLQVNIRAFPPAKFDDNLPVIKGV